MRRPYTTSIGRALDKHGTVTVWAYTAEEAQLWQGRMHAAAKKWGFVISTKWSGARVTATLEGWRDEA